MSINAFAANETNNIKATLANNEKDQSLFTTSFIQPFVLGLSVISHMELIDPCISEKTPDAPTIKTTKPIMLPRTE